MTTDLNKPKPKEKAVKNIQPNAGLDKELLKKANDLLNGYLADQMLYTLKLIGYHWNMTLRNTMSFEEQYTQLEEMIDQVAERIRTTG